jgi:hypothetical protein
MKPLYTSGKIAILLGFILLKTDTSFCQPPPPDYTFTSPALVSGTLNAVGSVYRFSLVKPGTDALVTITAAVNASVAVMDQTAASGGGYDAAFQPNITVNKLTTGYVDFNINFVLTGTSTIVTQSGVGITALDIDGYNYSSSLQLWEFEQFDLGPNSGAYYYMNGTDLSVGYVGNAIRGTNIGGVEYGSINLSQNVRFTMYKSSISNMKVRSGAINNDQFNNVTRQRSFYFARFSYTNLAVLAASDLVDFSGTLKDNSTQINVELARNHKLTKVEVEQSTDNRSYKRIADIKVTGGENFTITHDNYANGNNYYRLKLYDLNGNYTYSKILRIVTNRYDQSSFAVYPAVVSGQASLSVTSEHPYKGSLTIADAGGRVLLSKSISIQEGTTITELPEVSGLRTGNYIVVLNSGTKKMTQQIIVKN